MCSISNNNAKIKTVFLRPEIVITTKIDGHLTELTYLLEMFKHPVLKSESYKHAHATVLFLFSKCPINLLKHSAGSASISDTLPEPLSWP